VRSIEGGVTLLGFTRWSTRISFPQISSGNVSKCAHTQTLKLFAADNLTFDEKVRSLSCGKGTQQILVNRHAVVGTESYFHSGKVFSFVSIGQHKLLHKYFNIASTTHL